MSRRIAKALTVVSVLAATALPAAPADAAMSSSRVPAAGHYTTGLRDVTDANFQEVVLKSKKPVVVLFWAPWCGPCRQLAPSLEGIAQQHPEIHGVKLNVDENPVTTAKYNIQSIPTMVVFQKGKVAKTITGAKSRNALEKDIAKFLTKKQ